MYFASLLINTESQNQLVYYSLTFDNILRVISDFHLMQLTQTESLAPFRLWKMANLLLFFYKQKEQHIT